MQTRKNFITKNESFTCEACDIVVPPAAGTSRNHCPQCLTSKHVDQIIPGDRAANCQGLMPAITIEGSNIDTLDIVHQCEKCHKIMRNKVAFDDNRETLFAIMQHQA